MRRHLQLNSPEEWGSSRVRGFDGIVLGSEYCFHLLPDDAELKDASDFAAESSMEMTIMVPCLREHQLKSLLRSLRGIERKIKPRLVVNDWGTMYLFSKVSFEAEIVLGRLLSGQKPCVRIENSPFLTGEGKELLYSDLFGSDTMRAYFEREFDVTTISVVPDPEDVTAEKPYRRLIQYPYILVSVTDYCPYRGNLPSALISSCQRLCKRGYVVLSNDSLGQLIYQRGKGRFFNPFPERYEFPNVEGAEVIFNGDVP